MARPKRDGDWVPVTARVDAEVARRLRVAAAKRGITTGRLLDELVMTHLPPVEPAPPLRTKAPSSAKAITAEGLKAEMKRLKISQSDLARGLGISPRAVSEWFQLAAVPKQRHQAIAAFLASQRKKP